MTICQFSGQNKRKNEHESHELDINWCYCTLWKMLGCFNPILGKIWTNPAIGFHF